MSCSEVLPSPSTFPDTGQAVCSPLLSEQSTRSITSDTTHSLGSLWLAFEQSCAKVTEHSLIFWLSSHAHLRSERLMLGTG